MKALGCLFCLLISVLSQAFGYWTVKNIRSLAYQSFSISDWPIHKPHKYPASKLSRLKVSNTLQY